MRLCFLIAMALWSVSVASLRAVGSDDESESVERASASAGAAAAAAPVEASFVDIAGERFPLGVTRLNLGSREIREWPTEVEKLPGLEYLDLANNALTNLPFIQIRTLSTLAVSGNRRLRVLHVPSFRRQLMWQVYARRTNITALTLPSVAPDWAGGYISFGETPLEERLMTLQAANLEAFEMQLSATGYSWVTNGLVPRLAGGAIGDAMPADTTDSEGFNGRIVLGTLLPEDIPFGHTIEPVGEWSDEHGPLISRVVAIAKPAKRPR